MKAAPGYPHGEKHHRAKLTDAQVSEIRALNQRKVGRKGYGLLAIIFSCGESTIRDICTYRTRIDVA